MSAVTRPPVRIGPPPPPPEPTLVETGGLFAYVVRGDTRICVRGPLALSHSVPLDDDVVVVSTPHGWTSSYAGDAAWLQYGDDSRARVVIYPVADHHEAILRWHRRDADDTDVVAERIIELTSARSPFLYRYRRVSDNRAGIVYALRTPEGRSVLVHGSWPATLDTTLRPDALAIANCAETRPRQ